MLLALLDVPEADLVTTFSRVGMEPGQVRSTTLTMLGLSPQEQSADRTLAVEDVPELPHTHRINDVIECAIVEARDLNTASVTATCLLLGLLRERHGVAAEALARHGITIEMVREAVKAQEGGRPRRGAGCLRRGGGLGRGGGVGGRGGGPRLPPSGADLAPGGAAPAREPGATGAEASDVGRCT
ncbi:MAG: hypothetical protein IPG05_12655 [Gemmatimonadetes bacterium]|nr:hypothetical protein [Gemmatimonadota bacterium]